MGTIQWLHFSDLHLNKKGVETRRLRNKLPEYLRGLNINCDYAFCTGDIRYAPSGNFPENSIEYIQNICDAVHVPIDHLFMIPGNHDIDRAAAGRDNAVCRVHNATDQGDSGYYHPMDGEIRMDDLVYIANGQTDYVKLIRKLYSNVPARAKLYGSAVCPHFTVVTNDLNIVHLDSTITYSTNQTHDLVVGTEFLMNALEQTDKRKPTILLTHYSFDFLNRDEQKQILSLLQDYHVQLWLAGHEHKHLCRLQRDYFHEFQCGNLVLESGAYSCVLIGSLDLATGIGEICVHAWFPQQDWTRYPFVRTGTDNNSIYPFKLLLPNISLQTTKHLIENHFDNSGSLYSQIVQANVVARGVCGENAYWTLYKDGFLNIEGSGSIGKIPLPEDWIQYTSKRNANKITSVRIANGITSIGECAFNCYGDLAKVELPESLTSLAKQAFSFCSNLVEITIPKNVKFIEDSALHNCDKLRRIHVEPRNTTFTDIDGVLYNFDKTKLLCYPKGKPWSKYIIPNSVTAIGDQAFSMCNNNLKEIIIPKSVTSIGCYAFLGCDGLTKIEIPDCVRSIGDYAFGSCFNLSSISIPKNTTEIGYGVFHLCGNLHEIPVAHGNAVFVSINGVLFNRVKKELLSYPRGKIGTRYIVPNGVISIGRDAFGHCGNLTEVVLPDSVTCINPDAFAYCSSLNQAIIPKNVIKIEYNAFFACSSLTKIHFLGKAPRIGDMAFYGVTATAYYPAHDRSWTDAVKQDYHGKITWIAQD
ncbi:MAG: leucine-rich repeat protein [Clostridiales bacterium]|nr:leucine-rich repeat protein [Clostridiales bacterium]